MNRLIIIIRNLMPSVLNGINTYKQVLKNTFYLSIIEVIGILIPFISLPYIIKVVGAANFGKIALAQVVAGYFMILVNFGIDFTAAKFVSRNRERGKRLRLIVGAVTLFKTILLIIGLLLFSLLVFFWEKARADWFLYFSAYLICLTDVFFLSWFFQGIEKMFVITIVRSFSMLIYFVLLLLFLRQKDQYYLVPLFQASAFLMTSVYGFYYMCCKEKVIPALPSIHFMKNLVRESFPFFLSRSSVTLNNSLATLVIGITMPPYNVAVYDLAQKIARAFLLPACMLTQAIYPHNVRNKDSRFAMRAFAGLLVISILGLIVLYCLAPLLVDVMGNGQLASAIPILRFFEIYIFIEICSIFCGTPLLVAWGYSKPFNDSVFVATAGLLLMYGIFWCFGINSMYCFVAALLISELILLAYRAFYCVKYKIITIN